jgi:hypothetical protein
MKSARVPNVLVLATKEDMREFSEDPTAMPLMLMYKGEVLVSNDMQAVSLMCCRNLMIFFQRRYLLGCHHYEASSTIST